MRIFNRDRRRELLTVALIGGLLLPLSASSALADDVLAGLDLFETDPGTTFQDFLSTPVPADFFGPGSDPFDGIIQLEGNPGGFTLCPNDDLSRVDTIVQRLSTASLPLIGDTDVIDTEIVALSLKSVAPITVTWNGGQNPELWDVDVELSALAQPSGSMTIRHLDANGGTFDSDLPVLPKVTFTLVSNPLDIRVLDFGLEATPAVHFLAAAVPWAHSTPPSGSCTSNFCVNPGNLTLQQAPLAQADHGVLSICPLRGNHFKCWKVSDLKNPKWEKIRDPGISLDDQFRDEADVDVIKPFLICNPADKNGEGIVDPSTHQCCYKIRGEGKGLDPKPEIEITDQFGTLQLKAKGKPMMLCQPCTKRDLP